jgi:predicted transcriptional regulator
LKDGKKTLNELRDALGVSSTTAIHALRDLGKDTLILQDEDRNYALTKIGEVIVLKLTDFMDAIDVLKKHENFWLTHDLSGIPEHLLGKIGDLSNSILIADTPTDIFKSHTTFLQVLENANEVKGIYPIFNLEYLEIIEELVRGKGVDVELVVTNEALGSIEGVIEAEEEFKKILHAPNFTLFAVDNDIKIALTLTDSVFYLGLFASDGLYDYNRALISDDEKTLAWGRELHEHYRKLSSVVDL